MKWNIAYILQRLEPSSELKRRIMERARKLKAGRKTFDNDSTITDIRFFKEQIEMNMNNTNETAKIKNRFPVAVISAAACAALAIGIAALNMNKNTEKTLPTTAQDSSTSAGTAVTNDSSTPENADSKASENAKNETVNNSEAGSDSTAADNSDVQESKPERVEMSVDKMLSMDGAQLRALSNDDYEIVEGASSQCGCFGLKCTAFPEYVFVLRRVDGMDNKPENTIKVPYSDYVYELSDEIEQLNLYEGAEVGSGVTVGMTYNEIEEQLGHDIEVSMVFTTLGYAASAEIDGRYWYLHFDLTDEQREEMYERMNASTEKGMTTIDDPGHVDLSDMDPVCDLAVFEKDADDWYHGRTME